MKKMFFERKSTKIAAVLLVLAATVGLVSAVTASSFQAYDYDWWGDTYPVQSGYVVDRIITSTEIIMENGESLTPPLRSPQDVFIYEIPEMERDKYLKYDGVVVFFVDKNNSRIIVTDKDFKNGRVMEDFVYGEHYRVENFLPAHPGEEPVRETYVDDKGNVSDKLYNAAVKVYNNAMSEYDAGVEKYWSEVAKINTHTSLNEPTGIQVVEYDGETRIYIADNLNDRILACNLEGEVWMEYTRPVSETFGDDESFRPSKVVTDSAANVYVCLTTTTKGALVFSEAGDFTGFFGANRVTRTADAILNKFLRLILTREQMAARTRPTPVNFSNFTVDTDHFIYTVTKSRSADLDIVKKLDPAGRNVFEKEGFDEMIWGDFNSPYAYNKYYTSLITDISVDKNGDIYLIDSESGKIFQYDKEGNLMFIFGGKGDQKGLFYNPVALEVHDGRVYALDDNKGSLTVFKRTEFGELVLNAMNLFNRGLYKESLGPWEEVLTRDANYYMAYIGMGNAKLSIGEFKESLDYFYNHSWGGYERAFKDYRINFIRTNFDRILVVVFIAVLLIVGTTLIVKKIRKERASIVE